ncbi:hypothetical protein [Porphyromonas sp. HMSC065F10]|uniref:hypothetical protein n=1 Tax=Porphyromonas sp. HMSC065F10 TaxID=1739394 RepID=UPI0008A39BD1|nr:hypothetical protein [Porphyromonas sp. HMSC065F10]OFR39512.1 hypothetical protein HMPREF2890_02030 [Porphyromonas sp. HMSC065F10]
MRIYRSETLGKILKEMREGNKPSLFTDLERHRAFLEQWQSLPGIRLHRIRPVFTFDESKSTVVVHCSSSVALNLLRRERPIIEQHFRPLMDRYKLDTLSIVLRDSSQE